MFAKVLAAAVFAGVALAQTFSINTPPSIQQCQPAALSWVGGTAPFILAAIPEGQTTAPALATIAENVQSSPYTWNVNLPQGTAVTIRITDATGNIAYSSGRTVQAGGSGCLNGTPSGASSAAPSGASASSAAASLSSAAAASSVSRSASSAAPTSAAASSAPAASSSGASRPPTSSTPAASGAASSSSAAGDKAAFQIPVLALAGVGAFVALGGFATLF